MSSKLLLLLLLSGPQLHFNHSDFETEWWYYTGNLKAADGHRYGYELTFFRQANNAIPKTNSIWSPDQLYLAHLALSDIDGQRFEHFERLNRPGPGLAGADAAGRKYWNGNWQVRWTSDDGDQQLQAIGSDFTLNLKLHPAKSYVLQGINGISQKGPGKDQFSHYISFTRLSSEGSLIKSGKTIPLTGASWMDHEYFTQTQDPTLNGWDWFAIQLANGEDLMLYRLRLKSGEVSAYSSGTIVDMQGRTQHLTAKDFTLTPGGKWTSPASKASYPLAWHLEVPSIGLSLDESTGLKQQELYTPNSVSPGYWEGAVEYSGTERGKPVTGQGYLEMTGYLAPLRLGH